MNKLAQIEAGPVIMAIFGGIFAWVMASRMDMGIVMKVITAIATIGVCYWIAWFISNK